MKIEIRPAVFSRAQTIDAVKRCLKEWPLQDTNNVKAYECSIEFVENFGGPVATLSEFEGYDEFVIMLRDGVVCVKKVGNEYVVVPRYEMRESNVIWDTVLNIEVSKFEVYDAALKFLNL